MIPSQFQDFMQFVLKHTSNGNLRWTLGEGGSYIANHNGMSLYISSDYDPDREVSSFWFRLNGSHGVTPFSVFDYEPDYRLMRVIFEEIIANANNVKGDVASFMRGFD